MDILKTINSEIIKSNFNEGNRLVSIETKEGKPYHFSYIEKIENEEVVLRKEGGIRISYISEIVFLNLEDAFNRMCYLQKRNELLTDFFENICKNADDLRDDLDGEDKTG